MINENKKPWSSAKASSEATKLEGGKSQAKIHMTRELRKKEMLADAASMKAGERPEFITSRVNELGTILRKRKVNYTVELVVIDTTKPIDLAGEV